MRCWRGCLSGARCSDLHIVQLMPLLPYHPLLHYNPRVPTPSGKSWIFISKISRTWKVLENEFGPENSWKLKFEVLESPRIYMSFKLTNMHLTVFGFLLTETKQK